MPLPWKKTWGVSPVTGKRKEFNTSPFQNQLPFGLIRGVEEKESPRAHLEWRCLPSRACPRNPFPFTGWEAPLAQVPLPPHLIGYFSPGSFPKWKIRGNFECSSCSCVVTPETFCPGQKSMPCSTRKGRGSQ